MKIIVCGCLIAQIKRFDALITMQLSAMSHSGKNQEKSTKITFFLSYQFLQIFLDLLRNGTSQRAGVFLRCN